MSKCRSIFLVVTLAISSGLSLSTYGADLIEIYRLAKTSDAVYSSALDAWGAAQEKLPQGLSGLLPSSTLSASTQRTDRFIHNHDPALTDSRKPFNSDALTLSITQPIYRRQNTIVFEQSKIQVEQSDAVLAVSEQDLIIRVTQAYLDVLLAQDNVALADAQKTAIAEQLEQAKSNFKFGRAAITDTNEAQSRYDLSVSQGIAMRNDLEIKSRALEQVIGRFPPALAPLSLALKLLSPEPALMDKWSDEARHNNFQVRATQAGVTLANLELQRNRAGHYPTLDTVVTWGKNSTGSGTVGGFGNDITSKAIALQLSVPIFQGGLINSRVREAIRNESKAFNDLENARRTAEFNARQNYLGVINSIAQIKALEAALTSSQSALDSSRLGLKFGVRTQVDVLNAQQQLYVTFRDSAQAKYNYILATLRLKAAVGRLTEDDLVMVSKWLERK